MERRNAEGYHDPTAYGGIRMAEQKTERETVRMVYKNGRMELYIHEFFPCTAALARKVFPLIRKFAKEEDKGKLRQLLRIKAQEHSGKVKAFSEKAESLTAKTEEWHFYRRKAREEQIIYNQCVKNLKLLEGRKE
ncbi:MAG: hypothetical protein K2O59_16935 [Lachnospiraceae bacterium]|nr:hypothetical protein [Lachnospiraceae bacterium]